MSHGSALSCTAIRHVNASALKLPSSPQLVPNSTHHPLHASPSSSSASCPPLISFALPSTCSLPTLIATRSNLFLLQSRYHIHCAPKFYGRKPADHPHHLSRHPNAWKPVVPHSMCHSLPLAKSTATTPLSGPHPSLEGLCWHLRDWGVHVMGRSRMDLLTRSQYVFSLLYLWNSPTKIGMFSCESSKI